MLYNRVTFKHNDKNMKSNPKLTFDLSGIILARQQSEYGTGLSKLAQTHYHTSTCSPHISMNNETETS